MILSKICPICASRYETGEVFCPNDGSRLEDASIDEASATMVDPLVGQLLEGRYRILRQVGEGGMGIVYEAIHVKLDKKVALKVLRDDFSSRPEVVERFKQEARSASRIGNEHIVDISDFGETPDNASYFVMELLDGEDLANVLTRDGVLPLERAVSILLQCCEALSAAHNKGIVHRDMKPENIFLTRRESSDNANKDFVKLVDFGIAKMSDDSPGGGRKLTKTGMIFGTPEYMSPEQAAGKALDHRVDVYALGVILYEMLTGRVPFVGDSFMGILTQHMFEPVPPMSVTNPQVRVSPEVEAFILKALSKNAADRFASCAEMAAALQTALRVVERVGASTHIGMGGPSLANQATERPASATLTLKRPVSIEPSDGELAPKKGRGLVITVIAAALIFGSVGAWFASRPDAVVVQDPPGVARTPGNSPNNASGVTTAEKNPEPTQPTEVQNIGQNAGQETRPSLPPANVRISVRSEPSAQIKNGDLVLCETTPCDVNLPYGVGVLLTAHARGREGSLQLLPVADQEVSIPMRNVRRTSGASNSGSLLNNRAGTGELMGTHDFDEHVKQRGNR